MNSLHGNTEREEKGIGRMGEDTARENKRHEERSPVDMADMHQLTRQPGSCSRETNDAKTAAHSQDTGQVASSMEEPEENDRIQKKNEENRRRLAHFDKINRPPKEPPKRPMKTLRMSKGVFQEIRQTIGSYPIETGGLLMGCIEDFRVTAFIFDNVSYRMQRQAAVWYPHTESLNERVELAESKGLVLLGVVHSHPRRFIHPSGPDGSAAWSNMTSPSNPHLNAYLLPIVQSAADGPFECRSYVATCYPEGQGRVIIREIKLKLVD